MDQQDRDQDPYRGVEPHGSDDNASMVLRAEQVDVHTERVATGRVTLRKRVITEEVTVPVTLRREHLDVIEEDIADGGAAPAAAETAGAPGESSATPVARRDVRRLDDGDLEITLYAERPVVSVEVVPVERVRVSRGVVTDTEQVTVDVAHEEAYVEEIPTGDAADRRDGPGSAHLR